MPVVCFLADRAVAVFPGAAQFVFESVGAHVNKFPDRVTNTKQRTAHDSRDGKCKIALHTAVPKLKTLPGTQGEPGGPAC